MAKIPRINQGNRPSSVTGVAPTPDSAYLAQGLGTLAGVARGALDVAVDVEVQGQREAAARMAAEEKRLSEALDAKQKIVDAAEAGKINLEFEDSLYSEMETLRADTSIPSGKKVEEFTRRSRARADSLLKREDINDSVKFMVVKNAESAMGSGLAKMHSIVQAEMTAKAKADIAEQFNVIVNGAAKKATAGAAERYASESAAKLEGLGVSVLGPAWEEEKTRLKGAIAERYAAQAATYNPLGLLEELKTSKFLQANLTGDGHKALTTAAENGYKKLNDTRNLEIAQQAFAAGETLANILGTDEFIPAAAARRKSLEAERRNAAVGLDAMGRKLRPEDAKARVKTLDDQIKRVKVLQEMNYKQLDFSAMDDTDTVHNLTEANNLLLEKVTDSKDSGVSLMDEILKQQDALEAAKDAKKITRATYNTMKGALSAMQQGAVNEQAVNDGWFIFVNAEESGVREINKQFEDAYSN